MKSRRNFIKQSLAVSAGFMGLSQFLAYQSHAVETKMNPAMEKWLELPDGFTAKIISTWGEKMSDGFLVPGAADGMAAFNVGGKVVLVPSTRTVLHQLNMVLIGEDMSLFSKVAKSKVFDYGFGKTPGLGGTTTLIFNEKNK